MDYLKKELEPTPADRRAARAVVWVFALGLLAFYAYCCTRAYAGV